MPTLPTPVQHSPGILSQGEETEGIQMGKEIVKIFLFADDMILYFKDPKNSTPKHQDNISSLINVTQYKPTFNNSSLSIHQNKQIEKENKKTIPF
jgi:LAS superfamily LD-carboxypeptidase LdcB